MAPTTRQGITDAVPNLAPRLDNGHIAARRGAAGGKALTLDPENLADAADMIGIEEMQRVICGNELGRRRKSVMNTVLVCRRNVVACDHEVCGSGGREVIGAKGLDPRFERRQDRGLARRGARDARTCAPGGYCFRQAPCCKPLFEIDVSDSRGNCEPVAVMGGYAASASRNARAKAAWSAPRDVRTPIPVTTQSLDIGWPGPWSGANAAVKKFDEPRDILGAGEFIEWTTDPQCLHRLQHHIRPVERIGAEVAHASLRINVDGFQFRENLPQIAQDHAQNIRPGDGDRHESLANRSGTECRRAPRRAGAVSKERRNPQRRRRFDGRWD